MLTIGYSKLLKELPIKMTTELKLSHKCYISIWYEQLCYLVKLENRFMINLLY